MKADAVAYDARWRAGSDRMRAACAELLAKLLGYEEGSRARRRRRRPTDVAAFSLDVERLLCNVAALYLADAGHYLLAIGRRHDPDAPGSKTRNRLLDLACTADLLQLAQRGHVTSDGTRLLTRWRPLPALIGYLPRTLSTQDLELARATGSWIVIRSEDGRVLPLPPDAGVLADQVRRVNVWLRTLPLSVGSTEAAWLSEPSAELRQLPRVETAAHVEVFRTFSGDLTRGGRLYGGFWIQRPSWWRFESIRLAGEHIASCDYKEVLLRLAYQHYDLRWPFVDGECGYTAGAGHRSGWKAITNAMLAAHKPLKNWPTRDASERAQQRAYFPAGTRLPDIVRRIRARHAGLDAAGAFGHGTAGRLTWVESSITVALLLKCRDHDLPALPIHDCLLIPRSRADQAAELMRDTAQAVAGVTLPVSVELE